MAMDPVCKMEVDESGAQFKAEHGGKTYFFCCDGCRKTFSEDPDKYIGMGDHQGGHHGHH